MKKFLFLMLGAVLCVMAGCSNPKKTIALEASILNEDCPIGGDPCLDRVRYNSETNTIRFFFHAEDPDFSPDVIRHLSQEVKYKILLGMKDSRYDEWDALVEAITKAKANIVLSFETQQGDIVAIDIPYSEFAEVMQRELTDGDRTKLTLANNVLFLRNRFHGGTADMPHVLSDLKIEGDTALVCTYTLAPKGAIPTKEVIMERITSMRQDDQDSEIFRQLNEVGYSLVYRFTSPARHDTVTVVLTPEDIYSALSAEVKIHK